MEQLRTKSFSSTTTQRVARGTRFPYGNNPLQAKSEFHVAKNARREFTDPPFAVRKMGLQHHSLST